MTTVIDSRLAEVLDRPLLRGSHVPNSNDMCVMEAVAYVAGERWTDSPACASRPIAALLRRVNDRMDDEDRQLLKPLIARLVGSKASPEVEIRRAWLAVDWAIRAAAPVWLDNAGLTEHAAALRGLDEIKDRKSATIARNLAVKARSAAAVYAAAADDAYAAAADDAKRKEIRKNLLRETVKLAERMLAVTV